MLCNVGTFLPNGAAQQLQGTDSQDCALLEAGAARLLVMKVTPFQRAS